MLWRSGMAGWSGGMKCCAADRVRRRDEETCLRMESIVTAGMCIVQGCVVR
jgi:hypothetical protein